MGVKSGFDLFCQIRLESKAISEGLVKGAWRLSTQNIWKSDRIGGYGWFFRLFWFLYFLVKMTKILLKKRNKSRFKVDLLLELLTGGN